MSNPVFKTLSLSVVAFAVAATSSAYEQNPLLYLASSSATPEYVECSAQREIDRGWEYQRALLEALQKAKTPEVVEVKGAIISPPLPSFAPYRTDVPSAVVQSTGSRVSGTRSHKPTNR